MVTPSYCCFIGRKKKNKVKAYRRATVYAEDIDAFTCLQEEWDPPLKSFKNVEFKSFNAFVPFESIKVTTPVVACQGEDKGTVVKSDNIPSQEDCRPKKSSFQLLAHEHFVTKLEDKIEQGGALQRSCSSHDTKELADKFAYENPPLKSKSSGELSEKLNQMESHEENDAHKYDELNEFEVKSTTSSCDEENDNTKELVIMQRSPEVDRSMERVTSIPSSRTKLNSSKEPLDGYKRIQTLNSSSVVAHISGMNLRAVPAISQFSNLRSLNLSNNSIGQIIQGSLPKGLHTLDLSKNKICTTAGLSELTKLRVLNLSYNRISKLGYELANFRLLKELHLGSNKISEVEGLHRLQKLTVIDLSFNKITTINAMGQIVANYSSMLSINLLGNPIQRNISEQQLQKAICALLPKLAYLNTKPVNQKTKPIGVPNDILGKSSSRNNSLSVHGKVLKKSSQSGSRLTCSNKSGLSVVQKSVSKSKSRTSNESCLKICTL